MAISHATPLPLVSVIIPAYNCAEFVGEAVRSVLYQDYPRKEIIVVNDGSTDATASVLRSFGEEIRVVDRLNGGAAAARNTGLRRATGDYVAFLDGDDVWFPGKLALQVRYLEEHAHVGVVFTDWEVWNEPTDSKTVEQLARDLPAPTGEIEPTESGWVYHLLLLECILNTSTVLIRRSVINQVGQFDEALRNGQDYDYWLRMSRVVEIHKLTAPLAAYRHHGGNSTHHPKPTNYPYVVLTRALKRWGRRGPDRRAPDPVTLRRRLAALCFSFAYEHYWRGDRDRARRALLQCLRHRPLWRRAWLYLAVSLVPRQLLARTQSHSQTPANTRITVAPPADQPPTVDDQARR